MKRTILIYGSTIGAFLGLFLFISMQFFTTDSDLGMGEITGYSAMIIAFCFMYFGLKQFRDNHNNGNLTFGKAWAVGLLIVLIASMIYSLTWTVYTEVSDTDFMAVYMEVQKREWSESGMTDLDIEAELTKMSGMMEMYENPIVKFIITIIEPLPPGVIISFFLALILKRKNDPVEAEKST